jgi:hypothetical protein
MSYNNGDELSLENIHLYPRYGSTQTSILKSGTYYVWSNIVKNNRIRITNKKDSVGIPGQITGWVDIDEISKQKENFYKGDEVIVNGTLYTNSDGTGNTIVKNNETMYIVSILDEVSFPYNYALASAPNKTEQGWTNKLSIKKPKVI